MALDQIRNDTINSFLFYEWRGEKASGIAKDPVADILEWTRALTQWSLPNTRISDCKVTYDVDSFEATIYNKMVEEQRIGNRIWPSIEEDNQVDEFLDLTGKIPYTRQSQRRARSRDEEILQYFEEKNCPFFSGSDGGHLTVENNGVNRGASAAVLCAPYMEEGERFDDILDCWFERDIVIFVIRVSLLPASIGTVSVSSIQTEASGFCNLGTMLYTNPPQLLILDSNATVVNARNIRDNPNSPARRRVRGSGVAAGKAYCARMRKIFNAWQDDDTESIRGNKNEGQWRNLKLIYQQMEKWAIDEENQWRLDYFDAKGMKQALVLVDSHQYDDKGNFVSKQYKSPSPCTLMVKINEAADKAVMIALHPHLNSPLGLMESPQDVLYPPGAFRFSYSVDGKSIDGDTPRTIRKLGHDTFRFRAMTKTYQGQMLRVRNDTTITPSLVGRIGMFSSLCRHTSSSHSQAFYKNKKYRELHMKLGNVPTIEDKKTQKALHLVCPFCRGFDNNPDSCRGNQRHFHLYCSNTYVAQTREILYDSLENQLEHLQVCARKLTEISHLRLGLIATFNECVSNRKGYRKIQLLRNICI